MESQDISITDAPARQKIPDQERRLAAALFEAFRSGEDRDAIVRAYNPWMIGYFLHNFGGIDTHKAEDLAQDAWVRILEKHDQLRDPYAFRSWLTTLLRRVAVNTWKRKHHQRSEVELDTEVSPPHAREQQPVAHMISQDRRGQLRAALLRLKTTDRETLEAFYFRHRSLREMSDDFRAPEGTIKRRLHVARKRLRKELMSCVKDEAEWRNSL
ncbi:MAG: sigma-70 family RNA polymerase sigma factor [Candidatus Peribacteraceae bacterium]|nr:sigma-70 family RNA polymerase sigma factor [Candidatus Peribacteraceae bacterium]MDD5074530.1 sigma-70 family RNA polymerase sigma factor [Candidatus Peribacteraceae bacterium]